MFGKKSFICIVFLFFGAVFAEFPFENPAFEEKKQQLALVLGQGIRDHKDLRFERLYSVGITYSQPYHFFRLPVRRNAEFIMHRGAGEFSRYNNWIAGLSQDFFTPQLWRMYLSLGIGAYIKSEKTDRISSLFTFGQKGALGFQVIDELRLEFFIRHFSNGTLTETSSGYDFIGLSAVWNFGTL